MSEQNNNKNNINLGTIFKTLWMKKKVFFIMWPIVFALSCLWIFPQPRYYNCQVTLAPESTDGQVASSLSSLASSFGFNLGGSQDAIYPELYPDLMSSTDFIVKLFRIKIKTSDDSIHTDYYTYLTKYQKKNWLLAPFNSLKRSIVKLFSSEQAARRTPAEIDPFTLSEKETETVDNVRNKVICKVDKLTSVISISVRDQDPLVCAILADSVRLHLQEFITNYRTHKIRLDVKHYQELRDSANLEYRSAVNEYAAFCDANNDIILQSQQSKRDELENEMQMKYNTYQAMSTQLEAMKAKLQERTPAFTILTNATVPILPAGPKRMLFVLAMLVLGTVVTSTYILRSDLRKVIKF